MLYKTFSQTIHEVNHTRYINAYIAPSISKDKERDLLSAVKKYKSVVSAQLIGQDSVLNSLSKNYPTLAKEVSELDRETVPRYLKLKVDTSGVSDVQKNLTNQVGIEQVELNKNRYDGLIKTLETFRWITFGLLIGLGLAFFSILMNHFKLSSQFQKQVQNTIRLLGAGRVSIYMPFIVEGLVEGLMAGAIAAIGYVLSAGLLLSYMSSMVQTLGYKQVSFEINFLAVAIFCMGFFGCSVGSIWGAVRAKN